MNVKIRKGLNIKLLGEPYKEISPPIKTFLYAIYPHDYLGFTPKLTVKIGDKVKAGEPLCFEKNFENIKLTSPVSGVIQEIVYGPKRKLEKVIIKADDEINFFEFPHGDVSLFSAEQILDILQKSGLFLRIKRRPFGIVPKINERPKHIHISTFDTAPLAPDYNFTLKDYIEEFQKGVDVLAKLTDGKVHVNLDARISNNIFEKINNCQINLFEGPHPVGNVGVQIHHITPILSKEDVIWTLNPQDVVFIGRLFSTGKLDLRKIIAICGSEVTKPMYYSVIEGCSIESLIENNLKSDNVRIISGNVLTGKTMDKNDYVRLENQITIIPEGNYYEMFGWAKPGWNKYSYWSVFLSKLRKNKLWRLDTNYHGGVRPFVVTGKMEKVLPMDILPMQLLKAAISEDLEYLEKLGIYEVIEEDIALCEFISETKMDFQQILRNAINLVIKELE